MSANTQPPVTGRREWNKQQKRDRIVTAARALFYAQGYRKTTTQQIARAAKVASGTLFLYAKTKEDLLLLVFYDEFMAIINAISVSADDPRPVEQQVLALFNTLFDYHARDIELSRELMKVITFVTEPDKREDLLEIRFTIERKLHRIVRNAQERGVLSEKADALVTARILFRVYFHTMLFWLGSYGEKQQRDADLRGLVGGVLSLAYAGANEPGARRATGAD